MPTTREQLASSKVFRYWTARAATLDEIAAAIHAMAATRADPVPPELLPTAAELSQMVDVAFWASISPDERRFPEFSMVFAPPMPGVLRIAERPFSVRSVASLAPAVGKNVAHLGVTRSGTGELCVWGVFAGHTTSVCLRAVAPGRVILSLGHDNLAVFHRSDVSLLLETDDKAGLQHGGGRAHCAQLLGQAFASNHRPNSWIVIGSLLLMVAEAVRAQKHGGTLLVVPHARHEALNWLEFGDNKTLYAGMRHLLHGLVQATTPVDQPLVALRSNPQLDNYVMGRRDRVDAKILGITEAIGSLSAVDGAVVLSQSLRVLGFGVMVREPVGPRREDIERRSLLDFEKSEALKIRELGGARRRSAGMFVANNYDTVAVTASQDGALSLTLWVGDEQTGNPLIVTGLENLLD